MLTQLATTREQIQVGGYEPRARVVLGIRSWIEQGRLSRGDRVPAERALAQSFKVSRGTVRSAIDELRQHGLVSSDSRRPRVTGGSPRRDSLMAKSIVVLSREITDTISDRIEAPGWELFIERGALDAVFEAGLHGINLYPERAARGMFDRLLADHPMGVVLGRPAIETRWGQKLRRDLIDAGIPFVCYGNNPPIAGHDRVYSDHAAGSAALTRWLIERGCRRILRVWPKLTEPSYWLDGRNQGYEQVTAEAGLEPVPPLLLDAGFPHTQGQRDRFQLNVRAMLGYLTAAFATHDCRPDALMLASDGDVAAAAAALRLMGLEPGKDVKIVGYDNFWADRIDRKFEPFAPDATVDKLNVQIGQRLVRLLLDRIQGRLAPEPQARLFEPKLIIPDPTDAPSP